MKADTAICLNGELRQGDLVLSLPYTGYGLLVGTVCEIAKLGSEEHETYNETDDVYVNFAENGYSERRIKEIEADYSNLSEWPATIDEIALDSVIMAPDMLISINDISHEDLDFILESAENAAEYCGRVLAGREIPKGSRQQDTDADSIPVISKPIIEERLYSPVRFYLHNIREEEENGGYGGLYDDDYEISDEAAYQYIDAIELAILRDRDYMDKTRGMAEYFPDRLKEKVWSIFPSLEFQGDGIYCVANLELTALLTPDEIAELKSDWLGQLSDGWGEGFEQREIKVGSESEELYVVTWNSDKNAFFIDTQQEFDQRMGITPTEIPKAEKRNNYFENEKPALQTEYVESSSESPPDSKRSGYIFTVAEDSGFYIPNALHIERDDSMMTFRTDAEAAEAAKRDGISFIDGMDSVPDGVYIDTAENREIIEEWKESARQALPASIEEVEPLYKRLDDYYNDYRSEIMNLSKADIFNEAAEISDLRQAYSYFRAEHGYTAGQVEFLLKFQNPLELLSDKWSDHIGTVKETVSAIFADQECTLNSNGYELISNGKVTISRKAKDPLTASYTSVLDYIRKDKEEKRGRTPIQDDSSRRKAKRKGEEL